MLAHRNLHTLWLLLLLVVSGSAYRLDMFKQNSQKREGDVRLSGSKSVSEGRVEVYHDGKWGTVCDDEWDLNEAHVVCRQLNFPGAKSVVTGKDYGKAPGPIWLDDITCKGTEKQLVSCEFKGWGITDCSHKEDVGVICETGNNNWTISDTTHSLDHSIGLSEELGQIFDSGTGCDFLITLQTPMGNNQEDGSPEMVVTTICAHKMVLSLFPTFNISSGMTNITVDISMSCQPHYTTFIRYFYTHKIDVTFSSALCFHQMASKFGLKQLMEDIGRLFSKIIPEDTSFSSQVSLYQYAVQTDDLILEENCIQFLAWNYQNLTDSVAWTSLPLELLQALLTRSDLVVPDEHFVLKTVESWITQKANSISLETQAKLLSLIRFPMISAEKLYGIESSSSLYKTHENTYRDGILKAFQFNVLLFSNLLTSPRLDTENDDYKPRIYTAVPWSTVLSPSTKTSSSPYRRQQRPYNNYRGSYDQYYGYYQPTPPSRTASRSFVTPLHSSLFLQGNTSTWEADVLSTNTECSNKGLRCESVPAARLAHGYYFTPPSNILFRNRLLLICQDKYVSHIQSFKGNLAYIPTNDTQALTYPCPNDLYAYMFVVRPEYV
ncbi:galectin-3-binding protein A-like [Odontesthes bonariensis]|uniref:galectin-3-binding protein A-like n=1 Tax=Odontesthes bonariensis TaxID=219752 RepID=UPI003F580FB5